MLSETMRLLSFIFGDLAWFTEMYMGTKLTKDGLVCLLNWAKGGIDI